MYFPSGVARVLAHGPLDDPIIQSSSNSRRSLFFALTSSTVAVWRARPNILLSTLERTGVSTSSHGTNIAAHWAPDSSRIVIQTSDSHLVLVRLRPSNDTAYYKTSLAPTTLRRFQFGPGEAIPLSGYHLTLEGVIGIQGGLLCVSPRSKHILFSTSDPPAIQKIPWPAAEPTAEEEEEPEPEGTPKEVDLHQKWLGHDTWFLEQDELPWLIRSDVTIMDVKHSISAGYEGWITSDGRAYLVYLYEEDSAPSEQEVASPPSETTSEAGEKSKDSDAPRSSIDSTGRTGSTTDSMTQNLSLNWEGICIHGATIELPLSAGASDGHGGSSSTGKTGDLSSDDRAVKLAFNSPFSLIAVGNSGGAVHISDLPTSGMITSQIQTLRPPTAATTSFRPRGLGAVRALEWTPDGYALAVGWERGWAIYSVGGRCVASSVACEGEVLENRFEDGFMHGLSDLFWGPGSFELFLLAPPSHDNRTRSQLFVLPFAKSSVTTQQSPDNTRYAILQLDAGAMIYRGADQPDMSVINPEADVWQHIKIPPGYMASNWPVRYTSISNDGRLLAVAGRYGLMHWSAISGRWKSFSDPQQEQAFSVRGGLVWLHHVLVAAVESSGQHEIRLYSRDLDLSTQNVLHRERLTSPVVVLALVDTSLLVYTADNTIHHFIVLTTRDSVRLRLCGSISFEGVVGQPHAVRGLSWMIPKSQKQLGDPVNDLSVAAILMLLGGRLILLRPRKVGAHEVKYDMQILHERIEFCWIHLAGIGALENSLWGYDGSNMRIWLDALTIEAARVEEEKDAYHSVRESVNLPINFYPISVLMDKGIITGVEDEAATRVSLPFTMFKVLTSTHLFLPHVLHYHLRRSQLKKAVSFAANYQQLVFFSHALEVLLHTVLGSDADGSESEVLPLAIEFLDHFESSLEVIVGCARKTEMSRWRRLFDIVGNPKELFETCLQMNMLKTAASYLLVLHNLEQVDEENQNAIRLLQLAIDEKDWTLCRELLNFLRSIDASGAALEHALGAVGLLLDGSIGAHAPP